MRTFIAQVNCRDGCAEINNFDHLYVVTTNNPDADDTFIISVIREHVDIAFFSDASFSITELPNAHHIKVT
ncbi:hypothetical protein LCGC14_2743520 [marine sediment metagenome]|uniref:Uncharacterized protein n=1 Tax=marine sediment metagenome TaxID=412755 RepID=A0A0F8Z3X4_9ZZZZ